MDDLGVLREQLSVVLEAGLTPPGTPTGASPYLRRIAVHCRGRLQVVPVDQIEHLVADGVYVELHAGGETHLARTSLSALEGHLDPEQFFRIHRSAMVRLDEVESLVREGGGSCFVQLKSGAKLPVGRSRREELEVRLGRL
jgi:two-component system LytT family response regulator